MNVCRQRMNAGWSFAMCAAVLSLFVGCATVETNRDFPTEPLFPFSATGEAIQPDRWWTEFGNDDLDTLVEQALGQNFDLAVALQRLRAARAVVRREASDLVPDLDGVIGSDASFGPGSDPSSVTWGLDAAYQVDLWGQIQSRVDAERFRAQATQEDYHTVALSLAADVARTWFSLIESHAQLELLNLQLETNRNGLKAQESRFRFGDEGGAPDVYRQRQLVQATLEQVIVERSRVEVLEHQLAVLLGEQPQTAIYQPGSALPELPPLPVVDVPEELLIRRPDVRADFLAYVAADRDLASAISARFPRLNLSGSLVNSAASSDNFLRDWFLSIGGQLIAPLFDGGQRRAEVDRTGSVACQRHNEFGQTILIALQEVEDGLALERYQQQRIERLKEQVELAGLAAEVLKLRYSINTASFLDYLSATQSQQRLQRELLSARLELIFIRIGLYLAMAGDFDTRPQTVVGTVPEPALQNDGAFEKQGLEDVPPDLPAPEAPPNTEIPPSVREANATNRSAERSTTVPPQ